MPRTPDQVLADDALTEAIERCRAAYHLNDPDPDDPEDTPSGPGVTMEYIVVGASALMSDDGTSYTGVWTMHKDDGVPIHRMLGLMDYARTRWRKIVEEG